MSKNKVFRRVYTIEIKGTTTNDFMVKFLDSAIGKYFRAIADRFTQVNIIMMSAEEVELERSLAAMHQCPVCKTFKATPGQDCLFCSADEDSHANPDI